jgi:16S rRNA processing protein RimM
MKYIPVGQIVAAHGLKGEVKLRYYNESGASSFHYTSLFVEQAGTKIELKPSHIRLQGNVLFLTFRGLETVEKVGFLVEKELLVAEKDLAPLEEGEFYDYQLIGLEAVTDEGRIIGRVADVMHTGAHDILVVAGPREALVPMTEEHLLDVDREHGLVRIKESALAE